MTLPAELRAEASILLTPTNNFLPERDRAIAALLHRAADALEWRGIESAPTDGTRFLAVADSGYPVILNYCAEMQCFVNNNWHEFNKPAHWRPIDAPPPATPEGE